MEIETAGLNNETIARTTAFGVEYFIVIFRWKI